jgi:hypothetical protein
LAELVDVGAGAKRQVVAVDDYRLYRRVFGGALDGV